MFRMGTTRTILTFEEFENLPDQPGKCELLRGELLELPPAKLRHNRLSHRFYELLKTALYEAHARGEAQELGEACHEMGYHLSSDTWLQPDASVTHAGQGEGDYFLGSPAIAVEVISPSNTIKKMEAKAKLYFQYGAREVWHVNQKTGRLVRLLGDRSETLTHQDTLTTPLLPGFAMPLAEVLA